MASPSTSNAPPTPPPPPVQYVRRRSLAGPVVLIILGVLFLLGNLGYIGWRNLGYWFARYWPVLIILWGVIKLIEHYEAQRHGYRARGIGAGGVFLLICLILFGLGATTAWRYRGAISDEFQIDDQSFGFFGNSYNFSDEVQQAFPAGASLRVISERGAVRIIAWDEHNIKVSVQKKVWANSQSDADKVNAATKPSITVTGDVVTVNANAAASGSSRVSTDLQIYLPKKAAADIATAHGDVAVHDRQGDLKISTTHGDVEVGGVQGSVGITLRSGSVRSDNVRGDVNINGRMDDVTASNIQGSVRMNGDFFGSTRLSKISSTVRFQSSRTDMEIAKVDGELTMDSGDLRADSLDGPARVITKAKDIRLNDFAGSVQIDDTNCDIELSPGRLPLSGMQVHARRGRVHLVVPANAAFQLNAHASRGDISSDFPSLSVQTHGHDSEASGTVGNGGPQIQLSTDRGDIEISKG